MAQEGKAWQTSVLDEAAQQTIQDLAQHQALGGFYLGGGTALALDLGHRLSRDFDFFASESFDEEALL